MTKSKGTPPPRRDGEMADTGAWILRAAAVLLVLAGIVSLVPQLRSRVLSGLSGGGPTVAGPPATHLLDSPDTTEFAFEADFDSFDFELVERQVEGTIRIRTGDAAQAHATMISRTGTEQVLPIPGGLRIINVRSTVADYDVVVPDRVRIVRIVIGGQRVEEYSTREAGGADRTFDAGAR